jgi:hypothetical protein
MEIGHKEPTMLTPIDEFDNDVLETLDLGDFGRAALQLEISRCHAVIESVALLGTDITYWLDRIALLKSWLATDPMLAV